MHEYRAGPFILSTRDDRHDVELRIALPSASQVLTLDYRDLKAMLGVAQAGLYALDLLKERNGAHRS